MTMVNNSINKSRGNFNESKLNEKKTGKILMRRKRKIITHLINTKVGM